VEKAIAQGLTNIGNPRTVISSDDCNALTVQAIHHLYRDFALARVGHDVSREL